MPANDLTGGFKAWRGNLLRSMALDRIHSGGYGFQIELTFAAWKAGFRVVEIPIIFIDREFGESKLSKKIMWEAVFLVWKLRLLSLIKKY